MVHTAEIRSGRKIRVLQYIINDRRQLWTTQKNH